VWKRFGTDVTNCAAEAASSGRLEGSGLCSGRPQGADVLRQRLSHLLDLVRIEMMVENLEGCLRGVLDVDRPDVGETPRHVVEELFRRPLLERLLARVPLVVVETAHQKRQLRASAMSHGGIHKARSAPLCWRKRSTAGGRQSDPESLNVEVFPGFELCAHAAWLRGVYEPSYSRTHAFSDWNFISSLGAYVFAAGMAVFFANMILAFVRKAPAPANPWGQGATTLEWTLPSPPPFHQFDTLPRIAGPSLDSSSLENSTVEDAGLESSSEPPSREPRPTADTHRR
jgi:hypothetical protein